MRDTLVLNENMMPISILPMSALSWSEAIKLVFLDRADVLAEYDDWIVRSPSIQYNVPSVMMLREYVQVNKHVRFNRHNVYLRDNYECQYCGVNCRAKNIEITLDHVVPRLHGGKTNWTNVVVACPSCNSEKAHYDKMKPKKIPVKPSYYELLKLRKQWPLYVPHASWGEFLNWPVDKIIVDKTKRDPIYSGEGFDT